MVDGVSIMTPITLDGPLTFLGYKVTQEEQVVALVTYWQVADRPNRPFSLMGHLVGTDGIPVAIGDGLGVPWDQLQPMDILVQQHLLSTPQEMPGDSYWFQAGAYWLDTMERWSVLVEDEVAGDRILLMSLELP
jgi:hypothetical protein